MERLKLLEGIKAFRNDVQGYRELLVRSRDRIMPDIVKNHAQIAQKRSELTSTYAGLEKYIKRIGKNPQMNDGVWNVLYSPYDNAFSADTLVRIGPSIDAVLQDLDYITGKLNTMDQQELDELAYSSQKKGSETLKSKSHTYINADRIRELKNIKSEDFDLSRLIKYCEEINKNYENECFFSVLMLVRAILDHVSPIFNCKSFSEVSNNYAGTKSFKESMQHLESSSRKIADSFLHTMIRKKEVLPNHTQIDFSNDMDVLLSEILCRFAH